MPVLSLSVDAVGLEEATSLNLEWAQKGEGRYTCLANVHMTMEAFDNPSYAATVNGADLVLPDGKPLVWILKRGKQATAEQVRGTDLLRAICRRADSKGVHVGFLGGTTEVLAVLTSRLRKEYPSLAIALCYSPPFRDLSDEEQRHVFDRVRESGCQLLFVGLGCPKQERWMAHAVQSLNIPMIGIGAAFDFVARSRMEAPRVVQILGLEWLFRLSAEPRRLWRRYLLNNPRFVYYAMTGSTRPHHRPW